MARFNYKKARAKSLEIIKKFGLNAEVTLKGQAGGMNAIGEITPGTPDVVINGYASPVLYYGAQTKMTSYEQENVIAGDGYIFFYTDNGTPEVGMIHADNGEEWRVQSINELKSRDGVTVVLKLMLRK
ncbi:MAG: hypothetical protein ACTJHE_08585 [Vibrio casei]